MIKLRHSWVQLLIWVPLLARASIDGNNNPGMCCICYSGCQTSCDLGLNSCDNGGDTLTGCCGDFRGTDVYYAADSSGCYLQSGALPELLTMNPDIFCTARPSNPQSIPPILATFRGETSTNLVTTSTSRTFSFPSSKTSSSLAAAGPTLPLVSSSTTNAKAPESSGGLSTGATAGIVVGSVIGAAVLIGMVVFALRGRRRSKVRDFGPETQQSIPATAVAAVPPPPPPPPPSMPKQGLILAEEFNPYPGPDDGQANA